MNKKSNLWPPMVVVGLLSLAACKGVFSVKWLPDDWQSGIIRSQYNKITASQKSVQKNGRSVIYDILNWTEASSHMKCQNHSHREICGSKNAFHFIFLQIHWLCARNTCVMLEGVHVQISMVESHFGTI